MTPRAPAPDDHDRLTPASPRDVRRTLHPRAILSLRVHLRIASCRNLLMRESRRSIERWGLTLPQFDALAELARSGRTGFTFGELSRLLLVTSGNLTGIVDRLESEGLVRRQQGTRDRRVVRIVLTRKGRRRVEQIIPIHARDIDRALAAMPGDQLDALNDLLGILRNHLREGPGAPEPVEGVQESEIRRFPRRSRTPAGE
jgi:DNA-binding MarR family transcriptional regulator